MNEELEKKYDEFFNILYTTNNNKYHVLKTATGKMFKVVKHSGNIRVYPFTDIATPMTISREEVDKYLDNKKGNYNSYTAIILPYLNGEKDFRDIPINNTDIIQLEQKQTRTKNIILYGAPGVGKTHNYQRIISMIEKGDSEKDIFSTITDNKSSEQVKLDSDLYQNIKNEKRVEFVTFHQSYSYEDFIEGFRPQENGKIELEDGIFKKLSISCLNQSKKVLSTKITYEEAFDILRTQYIDDELETLRTITKTDIIINNFKEKSLNVQTIKAKDTQYIKKHDLEIVVNGILNKDVIRPSDIRALNVKKDTMSLFSYYFPIANKIVKIINENKVDIEEQKNFYLVIDEINRGNISKIFGELITLIEEDKRDVYEVTLPYSKEPFRVPSNLYIIATMNSTDKSIATIDIALRRRFTFLKMKPNLALVENDDARIFMKKLNIYIKEKLGEDYMLGHSYFMGNNIDLEFIKEYKIKPLLEEYFYAEDITPDEIIKKALQS